MSEKKESFGVSMSPELLAVLDKNRGLAKRSTYIEYLVKQALRWKEIHGEILLVISEIEEAIKVEGKPYPVKHPFRTPAYQMMLHDVLQRLEKIKALLTENL